MSINTQTASLKTVNPRNHRRSQVGSRKLLFRVSMMILGWAGSLLLFLPVAYMILKSFQSEKVAANAVPQLVFTPTLEHYTDTFAIGFWDYASNSFVVTATSTLVAILLALPAAWALSIRPILDPQGSLFFFISTKMMPIAAGIIPVYIIATQLHVLNTVPLLVVMHLGMNLPLAIWMLRSFMSEIPLEIIEASSVDGASSWRTALSVVLPLMRPGIASTALLCAVFSWNEFFFAANLTSSTSTLPLFLQKFLSFGELYTAQVAAVATVVSIPVIVAGWFAQKSLVRGLLFGAIK